MLDKDYLISHLKEKNYWWKTKSVNEIDKGILRAEYVEKIKEFLGLERIISLSGIRRSGKTTILYQLISHLLKTKQAEKIVFVKIDEIFEKINELQDIIKVYKELMNIDPKTERVYFIFDEIHFLKNWQLQLKHFLDSHSKSKFIISGSSKTLLYKNASESLAGRIKFIEIFPLTFGEFLKFNGVEINRQEFTTDFKTLEKFYHEIMEKKEKLIYYLNQYVEIGGFPEWFKIKQLRKWRNVLAEDYFSLIIFRDIVNVFNIKNPLAFEKFTREIAKLSTERFSFLNLSNRFDIDRETIKLYLYYLKCSMLVQISEVYTKNKIANEKKEKKIYFWEEGMRRAISLETDISKSIENIAVWHLFKRGFQNKLFFEPYYWKNKTEVDFVYDDSKNVIPVEIKFRNQITSSDSAPIIEFMKKFKLKHGIMVTKDLLKYENKIIYIPAWLFLLLF